MLRDDQLSYDHELPQELQWYYTTPAWEALRKRVLLIQGEVCAKCKATPADGATLQVHHKTYARLYQERVADMQVLCDACHLRHHALDRAVKAQREENRRDLLPPD